MSADDPPQPSQDPGPSTPPPESPPPPPPEPAVQPFATEDVAKEAGGGNSPQPSAFQTESIELDQ